MSRLIDPREQRRPAPKPVTGRVQRKPHRRTADAERGQLAWLRRQWELIPDREDA